MSYYLADKLRTGWYDISIMDIDDHIRICLIFSDIEKGTKMFEDLLIKEKRHPSFIAVERQDKGHDIIIDDNVDKYFKLQTSLTHEKYPSFCLLRQKVKPFKVFITTEDSNGTIISNGFGFDPKEIHYISGIDRILKKFENPLRWN